MKEEDYVDGIKNGDSKIFESFVNLYQDKIINTCYGFTHNIHDAEDIAQNVFVEVFQSISSFAFKSKLSTWVYRIAVNKSLNYLRNNKKRKTLLHLDMLLGLSNFTSISDNNDETQKYINREHDIYTKKLVFSFIDKLPKRQKTAFILNKYENLSYKEVADVMGVSISSVESLIHRAKMQLQNEMKKNIKKFQ